MSSSFLLENKLRKLINSIDLYKQNSKINVHKRIKQHDMMRTAKAKVGEFFNVKVLFLKTFHQIYLQRMIYLFDDLLHLDLR